MVSNRFVARIARFGSLLTFNDLKLYRSVLSGDGGLVGKCEYVSFSPAGRYDGGHTPVHVQLLISERLLAQ